MHPQAAHAQSSHTPPRARAPPARPQAFAGLMDFVRRDMYLAPHFRWYMREARLVAYAQFLESYKSVTLGSMAAAFDVAPRFLDQASRPPAWRGRGRGAGLG